jgi:hypothetical protein
MPSDGLPDVLELIRGRQNGVRQLSVIFEKKGRIQLPDGRRGFGVVARKVLTEVSAMLPQRGDIVGTPAVVSVGRGVTLSLGDFEFARIDESVSIPVQNDPKVIDEARKDCRKEIERDIEVQRIRMKGTLAEKIECVKAGLLALTDLAPGSAQQVKAALDAAKP